MTKPTRESGLELIIGFMALGGLCGFAYSMIEQMPYQVVAGYTAGGLAGGFAVLLILCFMGALGD